MTLKERAEKAAMNALREPGPHGQLVGSVKPRLVRVAEAIEEEAKAERERCIAALRALVADIHAKADALPLGDVIGGGDDWKDAAIEPWCKAFPNRVHVGRVNYWSRLIASWRAGAVSVDGTGWFHKKSGQRAQLRRFLKETSNTNTYEGQHVCS